MANKVWLGGAAAIPQVSTLTVTGTWVAAETITLKVGASGAEKEILITVGTDIAVADIAEIIRRTWGGDSLKNDESRNQTGNNVGEYSRITATSSAGVVTLTADDAGVPFTLAVTVSSTSGSIATATPTAATGPHHFSNTANWVGNAIPVDLGPPPGIVDSITFDHRAVSSMKYDMSQGAIDVLDLIITNDFVHDIGLPEINRSNPALPYDEYFDTYFTIGMQDAGSVLQVGVGDGQGSGRIKIDTGADQCVIRIDATGSRAETNVPAILLLGTNTSTDIDIESGDVGLAFFDDEVLSANDINVSFRENRSSDSTVVLGSGVTVIGDVNFDGGVINTYCALGTVNMNGAELIFQNSRLNVSRAMTTLNLRRGIVRYASNGVLATLNLSSQGTIDFRRGIGSITVTDANVYAASSFFDPDDRVTWTNGIDLINCTWSDLGEFETPIHKTWKISAV